MPYYEAGIIESLAHTQHHTRHDSAPAAFDVQPLVKLKKTILLRNFASDSFKNGGETMIEPTLTADWRIESITALGHTR